MRIVLWGATGQAIVLAELFACYEAVVEAIFDNDPARTSPIAGVPIFHGVDGFAQWKKGAPAGTVHAAVAVGGSRGEDRLQLAAFLESEGLTIATAIHPRAFVAKDARVGKGAQILAMSAVAAGAEIGSGCIVNTSASVDHGCVVGDGVHIGPGAHLAGEVEVKRFAFIGTGASVLPRIRIGERSIVGAGSVVLHDVEDDVVVAGNPARVLRRPA